MKNLCYRFETVGRERWLTRCALVFHDLYQKRELLLPLYGSFFTKLMQFIWRSWHEDKEQKLEKGSQKDRSERLLAVRVHLAKRETGSWSVAAWRMRGIIIHAFVSNRIMTSPAVVPIGYLSREILIMRPPKLFTHSFGLTRADVVLDYQGPFFRPKSLAKFDNRRRRGSRVTLRQVWKKK